MRKFARSRAQLRERIERRDLVVAPGVHGPMYARIAERAGFDALYMTGYGTANNLLGMPDVGLITMTEMVSNVRNICNAVNVPVIADMDTGYGNAINVIRSVREYEQAGAAAFHIEDQVSPKKCGFMRGKALASMEEMVGKIKACAEARDDPNMLIIARCDARGGAKKSPEEQRSELYKRCNAYAKAGADVIFPERPEKPGDLRMDLRMIKAPLLLNAPFGRLHTIYGMSTIDEARKLGFAIIILPDASFSLSAEAVYRAMVELKKTGRYPTKVSVDLAKPTLDYQEMIGLYETREWEEKFLPREELMARYEGTKIPRAF